MLPDDKQETVSIPWYLSYSCYYKIDAVPKCKSPYLGKKISISGGKESLFCALKCHATWSVTTGWDMPAVEWLQ